VCGFHCAGILDGRYSSEEALRRVLAEQETADRLQTTDVLIIDEISMISARGFDQVINFFIISLHGSCMVHDLIYMFKEQNFKLKNTSIKHLPRT
jgi:archaellum biogenesis ATPase FlaH